jgi:hypothetical protein
MRRWHAGGLIGEALDGVGVVTQRGRSRGRQGSEQLERDAAAGHGPGTDGATTVDRRGADDPAAGVDAVRVLGVDRERAVLPAEQVGVERAEEPRRQARGRRRAGGEVDELARRGELDRDRREPGAGVAQAEPGPRCEVGRTRRAMAAQVAAGELGQRRVAIRRAAGRAEPVVRERKRRPSRTGPSTIVPRPAASARRCGTA